ncbi:hypothetical protein ACA910_013081 [Epithemia clementina (nom. ined.)]
MLGQVGLRCCFCAQARRQELQQERHGTSIERRRTTRRYYGGPSTTTTCSSDYDSNVPVVVVTPPLTAEASLSSDQTTATTLFPHGDHNKKNDVQKDDLAHSQERSRRDSDMTEWHPRNACNNVDFLLSLSLSRDDDDDDEQQQQQQQQHQQVQDLHPRRVYQEPQHVGSSTQYPLHFGQVSQAAQSIANSHWIDYCHLVPTSVRMELMNLRSTQNHGTVKAAWVDSLRALGVVEREPAAAQDEENRGAGAGLHYMSVLTEANQPPQQQVHEEEDVSSISSTRAATTKDSILDEGDEEHHYHRQLLRRGPLFASSSTSRSKTQNPWILPAEGGGREEEEKNPFSRWRAISTTAGSTTTGHGHGDIRQPEGKEHQQSEFHKHHHGQEANEGEKPRFRRGCEES